MRPAMPDALDALFVLDPVSQLDPRADTSHVMITEALRRGHRPFFTTLDGLALAGGGAWAHARPLAVASDQADAPLVAGGPAQRRELGSFAVIFMRKDPPVDEDFITATWILDRARGSLVLNEPAALRDLNEKLSMLAFPELIPDTRLLRRSADIRQAIAELGGRAILKPVLGYGGREVLQAVEGDPNLSTLIELATHDGARWTVVQEFLPAASRGDKRILLVEGEAIGAVLRVPAKGELRNNFHAGGRPEATELSPREQQICAAVGPWLAERGVFFAGIDVIGDQLTEINVTSPTGMQEVNRLAGLHGPQTMQARFWDGVETRLAAL